MKKFLKNDIGSFQNKSSNTKVFEKAKWIWVERECKPDTYGEIYGEFNWEKGEVDCFLSCDGDYTLFINGHYVSSNQYGDFEWYKSVDKFIITPFLQMNKRIY